MKHKALSLVIIFSSLSMLFSCQNVNKNINKDLDTSKNVTLRIAIRDAQNAGLAQVASSFMRLYPNCVIEIEHLQDYDNTIFKRFSSKNSPIDIFFTDGPINVNKNSSYLEYALNLTGRVDVSNTYKKINDDYLYQDGFDTRQYSIPLGAEVSGVFVNESILEKYRLSTPTSYTTFVNECRILSSTYGYTPIKGHPNYVGFNLFFPDMVNYVINSKTSAELKSIVRTGGEEIKTMFADQLYLLYELADLKYYDYNTITSKDNLFLNDDKEEQAFNFLNITRGANNKYRANDTLGSSVFMPGSSALIPSINQKITYYGLKTKYRFILPLVSKNSSAYLQTKSSIGINKNSSSIDWSKEFVNYLMKEENITSYCEKQGLMPNVSNVTNIIESKFELPENNIVFESEINFPYTLTNNTETSFKEVMKDTLKTISLANLPENMKTNPNGTKVLFPFERFLENTLYSVVDLIRK